MHRKTTTLILPGVGNSGPDHWQSRWLALHHDFHRVLQDDWDRPALEAWCHNLEAAVHDAPAPVILVAHSLGCLLAVHWAERTSLLVRGALLVAPPDPASPAFPPEAAGFGPVPLHRLPFPTILVASSNDPYATPEFSKQCAAAWGRRLGQPPRRGRTARAHQCRQRAGGMATGVEDLRRTAAEHLNQHWPDKPHPSGTARQRDDGIGGVRRSGVVIIAAKISRDLGSEEKTVVRNLRPDSRDAAGGTNYRRLADINHLYRLLHKLLI